VTAEGSELLHVERFDPAARDGNENKLPAKIAALDGCAAVVCLAVGGSGIRQLLAAGVQPIKVDAGAKVAAVLAALRGEVRAAAAPWVAKALRASAPDAGRFDAMADEGWNG
jgi:nitrogen fixation protein NifX